MRVWVVDAAAPQDTDADTYRYTDRDRHLHDSEQLSPAQSQCRHRLARPGGGGGRPESSVLSIASLQSRPRDEPGGCVERSGLGEEKAVSSCQALRQRGGVDGVSWIGVGSYGGGGGAQIPTHPSRMRPTIHTATQTQIQTGINTHESLSARGRWWVGPWEGRKLEGPYFASRPSGDARGRARRQRREIRKDRVQQPGHSLQPARGIGVGRAAHRARH